MMRILAGVVMFFLGTLLTPWLLLPFAALHAFSWFALELVFIGFCTDVFFGVSHTVPYYTLGAAGLVMVAEWIKPQLSMYTGS